MRRHSGKLLTLAVVMNRLDLVQLLVEHGADVARVGLLGRLDDAVRPIADLLISHGKKVPDWMLPRTCRPDVSTNELHRVTVLLDYGGVFNDRGRYGLPRCTMPRAAASCRWSSCCSSGAHAEVLDDDGLTPLLHLAKTR